MTIVKIKQDEQEDINVWENYEQFCETSNIKREVESELELELDYNSAAENNKNVEVDIEVKKEEDNDDEEIDVVTTDSECQIVFKQTTIRDRLLFEKLKDENAAGVKINKTQVRELIKASKRISKTVLQQHRAVGKDDLRHRLRLERKRRAELTKSFHDLKQCIPSLTDEAPPKVRILESATLYIENLTDQETMMRADKVDITSALVSKLRILRSHSIEMTKLKDGDNLAVYFGGDQSDVSKITEEDKSGLDTISEIKQRVVKVYLKDVKKEADIEFLEALPYCGQCKMECCHNCRMMLLVLKQKQQQNAFEEPRTKNDNPNYVVRTQRKCTPQTGPLKIYFTVPKNHYPDFVELYSDAHKSSAIKLMPYCQPKSVNPKTPSPGKYSINEKYFFDKTLFPTSKTEIDFNALWRPSILTHSTESTCEKVFKMPSGERTITDLKSELAISYNSAFSCLKEQNCSAPEDLSVKSHVDGKLKYMELKDETKCVDNSVENKNISEDNSSSTANLEREVERSETNFNENDDRKTLPVFDIPPHLFSKGVTDTSIPPVLSLKVPPKPCATKNAVSVMVLIPDKHKQVNVLKVAMKNDVLKPTSNTIHTPQIQNVYSLKYYTPNKTNSVFRHQPTYISTNIPSDFSKENPTSSVKGLPVISNCFSLSKSEFSTLNANDKQLVDTKTNIDTRNNKGPSEKLSLLSEKDNSYASNSVLKRCSHWHPYNKSLAKKPKLYSNMG